MNVPEEYKSTATYMLVRAKMWEEKANVPLSVYFSKRLASKIDWANSCLDSLHTFRRGTVYHSAAMRDLINCLPLN